MQLTNSILAGISKHALITPTTLGDIGELNENARFEDRREVQDISGQPLMANLDFALDHAKPCLTARTLSNKLLCIFGVIPIAPRQGSIALIGTRNIERNPTAFLRGSVDVLRFLTNYPYEHLSNIVDARNHLHIAYLKWLGFEIGQRLEQFGHAKIPVFEFSLNINREAKNV